MTDRDHKLRMQFREESDEMLFANMELSEQTKQRILEQAGAMKTEIQKQTETEMRTEKTEIRMDKQMEKAGRRSFVPRSWRLGAAAAAIAILIGSGYALVQNQSQNQDLAIPGGQPSTSQPSGGATSGTKLSSLVTTPLTSVEDAKAAFGEGLRLPAAAPEGFTLTESVAVGEAGQPARDIVLTYTAGDKTLTFSASRMTATYPTDLFTPVQVGDANGFVFEQPQLVELYWSVDGIQYSIVGPVSADSALQIADSIR